MLLAVLQPELHWFSEDPSTFTAIVERAVGREEFDVLVLPTPSIACARLAETDTTSPRNSCGPACSRTLHRVRGYFWKTIICRCSNWRTRRY